MNKYFSLFLLLAFSQTVLQSADWNTIIPTSPTNPTNDYYLRKQTGAQQFERKEKDRNQSNAGRTGTSRSKRKRDDDATALEQQTIVLVTANNKTAQEDK